MITGKHKSEFQQLKAENNTSAATVQISTDTQQANISVHGLKSEMNGIEEVGKNGEQITNKTQSITNTAELIVTLSQNMFDVISISATNAFLQSVKMDHAIWKQDVYKVLLGQTDIHPSDFTEHTLCRLGKWYFEGEGAQNHVGCRSFKLLALPHKKVHEYGFAAMSAQLKGDTSVAIKNVELMEKASLEVVDLLTSLSNEISVAKK
ncbi:MAG: hypothetical protein ACJAV1_001307 [Paraglaciecola sp.]|jgi:hypothetical protein